MSVLFVCLLCHIFFIQPNQYIDIDMKIIQSFQHNENRRNILMLLGNRRVITDQNHQGEW